jgi:hypothetical protein
MAGVLTSPMFVIVRVISSCRWVVHIFGIVPSCVRTRGGYQ